MNMTMAVTLMVCTWIICSVILQINFSISEYTAGISTGWAVMIIIACWWIRYTQKPPTGESP